MLSAAVSSHKFPAGLFSVVLIFCYALHELKIYDMNPQTIEKGCTQNFSQTANS